MVECAAKIEIYEATLGEKFRIELSPGYIFLNKRPPKVRKGVDQLKMLPGSDSVVCRMQISWRKETFLKIRALGGNSYRMEL